MWHRVPVARDLRDFLTPACNHNVVPWKEGGVINEVSTCIQEFKYKIDYIY